MSREYCYNGGWPFVLPDDAIVFVFVVLLVIFRVLFFVTMVFSSNMFKELFIF